MNTMYDTPAGDGSVPGGTTNSPKRPRKRWLLGWGVGITLAGFLAGGGIALAMSGGAAPAASTAPAAGPAAAASQAQGAVLNSELNTASSTAPAVPLPRIRWALARLRALGGVHGEFTYHNKTGFHTLAFERGAIKSVSGDDVVVVAPDGTNWTWLIVSDTVVRQHGSKTTTSALSPGETVFAGGPVVNGARDARLIVIRPAGSGSTPSGSGSSSSSAGTSVS